MSDELILAGDVGGTKTNLAIFSTRDSCRVPLAEASFASEKYAGLSAVLDDFLAQTTAKPLSRACFGVAGPVTDGRAIATNLHWQMAEKELATTHNFRAVRLINDLVATATAAPLLEPHDLHTLQTGAVAPEGTIAVIAPGTGLGEAFLVWNGQEYQALASEGGHADFGPSSAEQIRLLGFLQERMEHVSYEAVCSGLGIPHIYQFLKQEKNEEPGWLAEQLNATDDPAPVLINAALDNGNPCPICTETLRLFIEILGAETGNLALKVMATGGVYLGGGIPPRILKALTSDHFSKAFGQKGRLSKVLTDIPIHVILNPKAALYGAAAYGMREWSQK